MGCKNTYSNSEIFYHLHLKGVSCKIEAENTLQDGDVLVEKSVRKKMSTKKADLIVWSWLPGLPKKVKWPVKQLGETHELRVFCNSDQALFQFKEKDISDFPGDIEHWTDIANRTLKRKPQILKVFHEDVEWALREKQRQEEREGENKENIEKAEGNVETIKNTENLEITVEKDTDKDEKQRQEEREGENKENIEKAEGNVETIKNTENLEITVEKDTDKDEKQRQEEREGENKENIEKAEGNGETIKNTENLEITVEKDTDKDEKQRQEEREGENKENIEKAEGNGETIKNTENLEITVEKDTDKDEVLFLLDGVEIGVLDAEIMQILIDCPETDHLILDQCNSFLELSESGDEWAPPLKRKAKVLSQSSTDSTSCDIVEVTYNDEESPTKKAKVLSQSSTDSTSCDIVEVTYNDEESPTKKAKVLSQSSTDSTSCDIVEVTYNDEESPTKKAKVLSQSSTDSTSCDIVEVTYNDEESPTKKAKVLSQSSTDSTSCDIVEVTYNDEESPTKKAKVLSQSSTDSTSCDIVEVTYNDEESPTKKAKVLSQSSTDSTSCDIVEVTYNDEESPTKKAKVLSQSTTDSTSCDIVEVTYNDEESPTKKAKVLITTDESEDDVKKNDESISETIKKEILEECNILRASDNPNIYIRKVIKQLPGESSQPKKKHDRVYNSKQACLYCDKLFLHLPMHLEKKHRNEPEVQTAMENIDKTRFDLIKKKGNNKHNKLVRKEKKGEMILARRPVGNFDSSEFGPCPNCLDWMNLQTLKRHQKKCKSYLTTSSSEYIKKDSKKVLQLKSDIMSGHYYTSPGSIFQTSVYQIMTRDRITDIAKQDRLIVALGESWFNRSVGNPKRKYYASQHMRLMSRLLINLRTLQGEDKVFDNILANVSENADGNNNTEISSGTNLAKIGTDLNVAMNNSEVNGNSSEVNVGKNAFDTRVSENTSSTKAVTSDKYDNKKFMWDFLDPENFHPVMKAAVMCAYPYMDDIEDLKAPSNAIKIKYDLIRMLDMKWSFLQSGNHGMAAERCNIFKKQMEIHWNESVTRLARSVLLHRSFSKDTKIPSPEDIKKLTIYLTAEVKKVDLENCETENFRNIVQLAQSRLLLFNKRRSGEIDHITIKQYVNRKSGLSSLDSSLTENLSKLEQHLLNTHDLMSVRGKRGRPVPVILPTDVSKLLDYLSDAEIRDKALIKDKKWLFPTQGNNSSRSYESLKLISNKVGLESPEQITSVSLRKYTATLSQVLNLNDAEIQWACDHLGHTKAVHLNHYRQRSGFIERVKMAKLMLLQDLNLTPEVKEKGLDDVELNDIIFERIQDIDGIEEGDKWEDIKIINEETSDKDPEIEDLSELSDNGDSSGDDHKDEQIEKKKKTRVRWSSEEIEEIKRYFKEHLRTKTCPSKSECVKAIAKSKKAGGKLANRFWHTIVKKISNMNKKSQKK